jgi:hypothetical protein
MHFLFLALAGKQKIEKYVTTIIKLSACSKTQSLLLLCLVIGNGKADIL